MRKTLQTTKPARKKGPQYNLNAWLHVVKHVCFVTLLANNNGWKNNNKIIIKKKKIIKPTPPVFVCWVFHTIGVTILCYTFLFAFFAPLSVLSVYLSNVCVNCQNQISVI